MLTSAEEFIALRSSQEPREYLRAATEPASREVWLELIHHHPSMKVWVIHNKTIPLDILDELAGDESTDVRVALAMKNKLSRKLYEVLSSDEDCAVRERIVYNKNTPIDVLEKLARDPNLSIAESARSRLELKR